MPKQTWSEQDEETLARLWIQTDPWLSSREIGRQMRRNKNQIIGKAARLGLPLKKKPRKKLASRSVALVPRPPAKPKKPQRWIEKRVKKGPAPVPVPVPGGLHIMELNDHHCRSIIGHGLDGLARYCGAQVAERPVRYRGVLVTDAAGNHLTKPIAWCEGHAAIYLNPHDRS